MKKVTDKKAGSKKNNALATSEDTICRKEYDLLNDVVESMSDFFVAVDFDWTVIRVNKKAAQMFSRKPEDIIGKNLLKDFPETARAEVRDALEHCMKHRESAHIETHFAPLNKWRENRVFPTTSGIAILFQDITDRKEKELALQKSEERFRLLIEHAVDGIFQGDAAGNFIGVNSRGSEMTGYTTEELLTMNMGSMFTEEEKKRTPLRYDLLNEGHMVINERKITRKDGRLLDIEMNTKRMPDGTYLSFFRDITLRKRSEAMIRESELRYRTIFENTGTAAIIIEDDTQISLANTQFEKLSGYLREEIEFTMNWPSFVHPDDRAIMVKRHQERRLGSVPVEKSYEFRFINRQGEIRNILLTVDLIPGTKKSVASMLDITDRKNKEIQLQESESRYRELFELSPAPMLIYEKGTLHFVDINEAFAKKYGYPRDQILRMKLPDLYPPQQKGPIAELAARINGHRVAGEWQHVTADGSVMDIIATSNDLQVDGRPCRIAVINDITEIRRVETELRNSENNYRRLIDTVTDAIVIIQDGVVKFVNSITMKKTGYSYEELIGYSFLDKVAVKDRTIVQRHYQARMKGVESHDSYEIEFIARNGQVLIAEATGSLFYYQGRLAELVVLHDVTQRKKMEQEVIKAKEELEERVKMRTKQLAKAIKELETLNNTKDKFFSIIAHDLKNPIAVIINSAEMLIRTIAQHPDDQERLKRYSENILVSTQNGYKLLENLLAWSRSQSGRIHYQPANTDLNERLNKCITELQLAFTNKSLTILNESGSQTVWADPNMLDLVLRNLLTNAAKYSNKGGTVTIRSSVTGPLVKTEIRDEGVGMSPETLIGLFRLDTKITTPGTLKETGTGLGLILCKEFIDRMGGKIWAESTEGQGSSFFFTLPTQ